MPAMLDDPDSPTIYRLSGAPPYPDPDHPALPADMSVRQVTLRDRQTVATIVPFASRHQVPASLLAHLCDQLNKEIEGGDTYPMVEGMSHDKFARYWFQNFGAIMLLGSLDGAEDVVDGKDWAKECLGSFYIKPNYPGRSSHVCNAGFLVTDAARNRGVGRLMGEAYLDWAPRLGYSYSVFNLVYETNVASCKIWDALGFKRIGRVKGCGNLKSHPGRLIDAIIYGRDLAPADSGDEQLVSEERFDKIKFYLKYARYPNGADRAEKSRLRSAATHYKLVGDRLMLKDKEVIADPARQYDIARGVHVAGHAGINKSTATIAERFHWSGIKQTVSDVIRNCAECKELGKTPVPGVLVGDKRRIGAAVSHGTNNSTSEVSSLGTTSMGTGVSQSVMTTSRPLTLPPHHLSHLSTDAPPASAYANPNDISVAPSHHHGLLLHDHDQMVPSASVYQPIDPQMIDSSASPHHVVDDDPHNPFGYHDPDEPGHDGVPDDVDVDVDDADHTDAEFRELLRAAEADSHHAPRMDGPELDADRELVDRDLDMLIEHAVRGDLGGDSVDVDVDHDMGDVAGGEEVHGRDGRHDDDHDDDDGRNTGDGGTKGAGGGLYHGIVRFDGAVL